MQQSDDAELCLFPTDKPKKFGMVRCQGDRVVEIIDKPTQRDFTFMWGCIIWSSRFTDHLHSGVNVHGMTDFAAIINQAIQAGHQFSGIYPRDGNYVDEQLSNLFASQKQDLSNWGFPLTHKTSASSRIHAAFTQKQCIENLEPGPKPEQTQSDSAGGHAGHALRKIADWKFSRTTIPDAGQPVKEWF
jgi:hypothetical protein